VVLWSRRGNVFTDRFRDVANACQQLPPDTLIDGEVVAIGDDGRASFNLLQHTRFTTHAQLYAFDILIHRGHSVQRLPLERRREILTSALKRVEYPVIQCQGFDAKPTDMIR